MIAYDLSRAAWRKSSYSESTANCVEVAFVDAAWRKSSYSADTATCVEVAVTPAAVATRDTKNPTGPVLTFPVSAWHTLVSTVD
ncbi:uncharacterized protein DUF397 [Herbihabitans rhizosphaerae]|uniref:Uncharacterized protein DUF397 n=1 Tax=Herbihabitans rhizosphaerae TaxID=1872711 RepID=A0A4Q7KLZ1_9PSEU|nr:DUF397 domain-containing protein [Herbihabitans rhizosphaerae]RZS37545.1 uncharacterized protein DUF397 [Herbihabitans rhizosphaerae]